MAAVNVTFPGNLAQVKTANDLRSVPSTLLPLGALFLVNGLEGLFEYDPGSVAADDGKDVLRPYDKTPGQVGRWLRNVDGLATGPEGPTGPANSTYLTKAALTAAPVTNGSYIFAPPSGSDGGAAAGTFLYQTAGAPYTADGVNVIKLDAVPLTTGALVRQAADGINFDGRPVAVKIAEIPAVTDTANAGGAKGDASTDNAAALGAALQPTRAGYKSVPAGVYSTATVTRTLAPGAPHHIDGDGPGVSVIRKLTNDASIALDLAGTPDNLDNHTVISNLSFDNGFRGANGTGLRLTNTAREVLQNVVFDGLGTGFYARGALLLTNIAVTFRGCERGFVAERSTDLIYPNMNKFIGGTALGCSLVGFDINHASGFGLIGVNVEANGVTGDMTTGGMLIRPQIAAETGFSSLEINGHFERNKGFGGLRGSSLAGLVMHVRDSDFVSNEAAQDMNLSGAWSIGLTSNQGNGVTRIQARMSFVMGGFYNQLIDTSDDWFHHTETADGKRVGWMSQFRINHDPAAPTANDLLFGPASRLTGGPASTSMLYKFGSGNVVFQSATGGPKFAWSSVGVSFHGNNPVAQGAAIPNPTDAASTQSALIALLAYLRNRGDIAA